MALVDVAGWWPRADAGPTGAFWKSVFQNFLSILGMMLIGTL